MLSLLLVPIEPLFRRAARLAHDVALKVGKPLRFDLAGSDTELDKGMVEELFEPLVHLVRNAVDHGLETPEERRLAGKDPQGGLRLSARRESGDIVLELADDGRGLDPARLLEQGLARGLVRPGESPTAEQLTQLIFEPGFSTARQVSDLSGRGVGLDAVKKRIQALKGAIQVESRPGLGCRFTLRFPLTMALMEGVLVSIGGQRYVLPASQVRQFLAPDGAATHQVGTGQGWLEAGGASLPLLDLGAWFHAPGVTGARPVAVHVEASQRNACLLVDAVLGRQQVVVKGLGQGLSEDLRGVSGGAILGDGRVGMILDLETMLNGRG